MKGSQMGVPNSQEVRNKISKRSQICLKESKVQINIIKPFEIFWKIFHPHNHKSQFMCILKLAFLFFVSNFFVNFAHYQHQTVPIQDTLKSP